VRLLIALSALLQAATVTAQTRVFYAGDAGKDGFHDVHALSDGTF